jgi:hypothetical protein
VILSPQPVSGSWVDNTDLVSAVSSGSVGLG